MKKGIELLSSIINNDPEAALYETGMLLQSGDIDTLEKVWIRCCAIVGENLDPLIRYEFVRAIRVLSDLLDEEKVIIKEALLFTLQLCFLCDKTTIHEKDTIAGLKEKIEHAFPDNASLSSKGATMYKTILPKEGTDENKFIQRVLAGLSKLWDDVDMQNSKIALEYLSRRRLPIKKPKGIMPAILEDSDILWTLWGAALLYYHGNPNVATSYKLFTWNYVKSYKTTRAGLLWVVTFLDNIPDDVPNNWTPSETALYNRVSENFRDIWKQMQPEEEQGSTNSKKEEKGIHALSFEPRGSPQSQYYGNYCEEKKTFKLKTSYKNIRDSKINKV